MRQYPTDTTRRLYFTEYSSNALEEISYCVAVPSGREGEYIKNIPVLKAVSFFHHGAYEDIPKARKNLFSMQKNITSNCQALSVICIWKAHHSIRINLNSSPK